MIFLLVCLAVFVGAFSQRLAGMGFALIAAPFLVILLGPQIGVVVVSICGLVSSVVVLLRTLPHVEWKHAFLMGGAAAVGTVPGALLAGALSRNALEIFIGAIIVLSLAASLVLSRYSAPIRRTSANSLITGALSGAMGTSAGVSGPPLSAYAVLSRWDQWKFAATIQPVFVMSSAAIVLVKVTISPESVPTLTLGEWVVLFAALGAGQLVGDLLSTKIPVPIARRMMLTFAFAGGLLTLGKGLWQLSG